jgi:hypothetical protein
MTADDLMLWLGRTAETRDSELGRWLAQLSVVQLDVRDAGIQLPAMSKSPGIYVDRSTGEQLGVGHGP